MIVVARLSAKSILMLAIAKRLNICKQIFARDLPIITRLKKLQLGLVLLLALVCLPSTAQEDSHPVKFQQYQKEGIAHLNAKDYAAALQSFEAALKEHSSWQTLQNIAICHTQLGDFTKAVTDEKQSIEVGGIHANQCITMAGALEGLGQTKQALAWLDLACSVDPARREDPGLQAAIRRLHNPTVNPTGRADLPDYLSGLTAVHLWRKQDFPLKVYVRKNIQIPEFYEEYTRIVRESIDQWCLASNGAISYKLVKEPQGANVIWDYTDRRELVASDHEPGLWGVTEQLYRGKDGSQGDGAITVLVRKGPHAPFLDRSIVANVCLHEMGHALGMHGHSSNMHDVMFLSAPTFPVKLSQRDINTIRKMYPDLQMQGFAYVKANDFAKALDCFNAALKERPDSWMIMQSIGNCEQSLGHYDKAIEYYVKSIEVGGVHGIQCRNISTAYESNRKLDKALYWLKRGSSIDPAIADDPQVKATIMRLDETVKNKRALQIRPINRQSFSVCAARQLSQQLN